MRPLQICIGPTIRIGRESWFLYAGFFFDKSCNLSKIVSVLRSASVERFDVSRMQDFFFFILQNILCPIGIPLDLPDKQTSHILTQGTRRKLSDYQTWGKHYTRRKADTYLKLNIGLVIKDIAKKTYWKPVGLVLTKWL